MIAGTSVRLADVIEAWPRHAARIARCGCDAGTLHWIYQRCVSGLAVCLECEDGMAVIEPRATPEGTIDARVLLAVSTGQHGALERQEAALLVIARELGTERVSFRTDRAGWARLLGPEWQRTDDLFWRTV